MSKEELELLACLQELKVGEIYLNSARSYAIVRNQKYPILYKLEKIYEDLEKIIVGLDKHLQKVQTADEDY